MGMWLANKPLENKKQNKQGNTRISPCIVH